MKAISLWQPWASLFLTPSKIHETRSWPYPHRGPLAVHAAKTLQKALAAETEAIVVKQFGADWRTTLPLGAVIGAVEIIDCRRTEDVYVETWKPDKPMPDDYWCGDFAPGRFAWLRRAAFTLPCPQKYTGRQNIFSVPDDLLPGIVHRWDGKS
jgi:activating signal cointegrator 1